MNNKRSDNLFEFSLIGLLMLAVVALLVFGLAAPAKAADPVYACRDMRYETVRIEIHNIPAEWFSVDGVGIWMLADGYAFYPESGVTVMDALVPESIGMNNPDVYVGEALLGTNDYQFEIHGDADSPACDVSLSPVQEQDPPPTSEPTPTPAPVASQPLFVCLARANNPATNQPYCYTPRPDGVIPIPPPPAI